MCFKGFFFLDHVFLVNFSSLPPAEETFLESTERRRKRKFPRTNRKDSENTCHRNPRIFSLVWKCFLLEPAPPKIWVHFFFFGTWKPVRICLTVFKPKLVSSCLAKVVCEALSALCGTLVAPRASLVAQLVKNPPAVWETWVGKIPWRRERLPTLVFWPGDKYSPWGRKESYTTGDFHFHHGRGISPEQNHKYFSILFETVRWKILLWLAVPGFSECCRLVLWLPPTTVFDPEEGTCPLPYAAEQRQDVPGCSRTSEEKVQRIIMRAA